MNKSKKFYVILGLLVSWGLLLAYSLIPDPPPKIYKTNIVFQGVIGKIDPTDPPPSRTIEECFLNLANTVQLGSLSVRHTESIFYIEMSMAEKEEAIDLLKRNEEAGYLYTDSQNYIVDDSIEVTQEALPSPQ